MAYIQPSKRESESPLKRTKPYKAGMSAGERKAYNKKTGGNLRAPQPGGVLEKNLIAQDLQVLKNVKIQIKTGIVLTTSLE